MLFRPAPRAPHRLFAGYRRATVWRERHGHPQGAIYFRLIFGPIAVNLVFFLIKNSVALSV